MSFEFQPSTQPSTNTGGNSNSNPVDWDALNQHVIETVDLQESEAVIGVVSGIVGLGVQEQEPAEEDYKQTSEQEEKLKNIEGAEVITKYGKEILTYPRKDREQVAIFIDFPQYMVDKGKFFGGESNPSPFRIMLNGEFMLQTAEGYVKIVQRGYNLAITNHGDQSNKLWGFGKNSTLHKLGAATNSLNNNGLFLPQDLGKLLSKPVLVDLQVFMKPSKKDASKSYYTEICKLQGKVPKMMESMVPELDDKYLFGINFDSDNNPNHLKQLRASVKNTIKRAKNYEGSKIQQQLGELEQSGGSTGGSQTSESSSQQPDDKPEQSHSEEDKSSQSAAQEPEPQSNGGFGDDDFEDDIPF